MADKIELEEGWELCCKVGDDPKNPKDECCKSLQGPNEAGKVWCDDVTACREHKDPSDPNKKCGCYVFRRFKSEKDDGMWYPDCEFPGEAVKERDKTKWDQRCFCVRKSKPTQSRLLRDVGQLLIDLSLEQEASFISHKLPGGAAPRGRAD